MPAEKQDKYEIVRTDSEGNELFRLSFKRGDTFSLPYPASKVFDTVYMNGHFAYKAQVGPAILPPRTDQEPTKDVGKS